ncbi:MAG: hypothetical protein IT165_23130 [Bryobacterales bacterium]|nr:hypothetical protein [Bryobacterales bacterium]
MMFETNQANAEETIVDAISIQHIGLGGQLQREIASDPEHTVADLAAEGVPLHADLGGGDELSDPRFVFQLLQLRGKHPPRQPGLGERGRLLAGGRLIGFVIQHGVRGGGIYHPPARKQDAGFGKLPDVLRALVPVARVPRLGHQNGPCLSFMG